MDRTEDAGVYRLSDELAIIQTLDFFTPIVDDPYLFGQIAAANALSDVYSMGGRPLTAMNIVCFPINTMDIDILKQVLKGGLDKVQEASVALLGGHSVEDRELKYGMSVTGVIHPDKIIRKEGGRPGDKLILTKPLGTGIISTAIKAGKAGKAAIKASTSNMTTLNRKASELMTAYEMHACTDVTGFGLIGHACEMVENTDVGLVIDTSKIPLLPETLDLAKAGSLSGGLKRNLAFRAGMADIDPSVPDYLAATLFDPQTSGGLLISVAFDDADVLLSKMHENGIIDAAIIGEVVSSPECRIIVK